MKKTNPQHHTKQRINDDKFINKIAGCAAENAQNCSCKKANMYPHCTLCSLNNSKKTP